MDKELDRQLINSVVSMMDRLCGLSISYIKDTSNDSSLSDLEEAIYDAQRLSDRFKGN